MSDNADMTGPQPGHFSWNELISTDTTASAEFYGSLFGWKTQPFGESYMLFKLQPDDAMGLGGMMAAPAPGMPARWLPYVVVADVDAALAKAVELGATALMPVMSVPDVGRITVIADPQGAVLGLHELAAK